MAVEIPVVVDIDGAFREAANRVKSAIKPLEREVSQEALNLEIVVGFDSKEGTPISMMFKEIRNGAVKDMATVQNAIAGVKDELANAAAAGDKVRFTALLEAKTYMEDLVRAANVSRSSIDGLSQTFDGLSAKIAAAQMTLNSTRLGSEEWKAAIRDLTSATREMEEFRRQMTELGMKTGSLDALNFKLQELERRWQSMSEKQMFDSSGGLTKYAQKTRAEFTSLYDEIERRNKALREQIVAREKAEADAARAREKENREIQAQIDAEESRQAAEKKHREELAMVAKSIDDMNTKLRAWQQEVNSTDFGDVKWQRAALLAGRLSRALANMTQQARIFGAETGSIDQLNAKLQLLTQKYNALSITGRQGAQGKEIIDEYRKVSSDLEKEAVALDKIIQKEKQRASLAEKGQQRQRYENAILNTTVKTIRVLEEKERILSERLKRTEIGSRKYKQLKEELEGVRSELEQINGRVEESTVPALDKANNRLAQLVKRAAQLFVIHSAATFARNIRDITAEFELQRVSLGSIIQDVNRAESLFKEIKVAAIRSPFEIKDLVKYTKELSAYRIETENLFKVTMQLADISAGLGVDMERLILAYGQVRSAAVLRGQELRQFSEAGIPLVKLLAEKFKELGREGTTTADVFELISKRAVSFEMVAEIFDDMTKRGGMFYKMQEKQAETLLGQWNNLKDALSIMYDEMGNTTAVHNAMTDLIGFARDLFQNWRLIGSALTVAAAQFGAVKLASLWLPNLKRELALAKKAQDALTRSQELSKYAMETGSRTAQRASVRLQAYSDLLRKASLETRFLRREWLLLKASMMGGGWITLASIAVVALTSAITAAIIESGRLKRELARIGTEGEINITRSIANFERLAKAAVDATDGSKEQADALAELKRTYGDIIPTEQLRIDNLRKMAGNYNSLTRAIREKIEEQVREQKINTLTSEFSKKLERKQKPLKRQLRDQGFDTEQINAIFEALGSAVEKGIIDVSEMSFSRMRYEFGQIVKTLTGRPYVNVTDEVLGEVIRTYGNLKVEVDKVNKSLDESVGTYGRFAKIAKELDEDLSKVTVDEAMFGKKGSYLYNQEEVRQKVKVYMDYIRKALVEEAKSNADLKDALSPEKGIIDFGFVDKAVSEAMSGGKNYGLNAFIQRIQESYEQLVPSDRLMNLVRSKVTELAEQFSVPMDVAQRYFIQADTSSEDWLKSLREQAKETEYLTNQMRLNNEELKKKRENWDATASIWKEYSAEEIEANKNLSLFEQSLIKFFESLGKAQKTPKQGYTEDPFIQLMKNRMAYMKDFKKGYDDLKKYLGEGDALTKQADLMLTRGMALGIKPDEQKRAATDLSNWYQQQIDDAFAQAKKKGATGRTVTDFLSQEIKTDTNQGKTLKAFQQLIQSLFDAKTDLDTSTFEQNIEREFKAIVDRIKKSEAARNFFNDIFDTTGDQEIARSLTVSVYGDIGSEFADGIQQTLNAALSKVSAGDITPELTKAIKEQDFDVILKNIDKFPDKWQETLKQMAADSERFHADQVKQWVKDLEKIKTYGEKRVALAEYTAKRIAEVEASSLSEDKKKRLTSGYKERESKETAKLQYEAFKDSKMYISIFEKLDSVSYRMLKNMREQLVRVKSQWKDLDPTQIKELQSRIEELDKKITERNPFQTLIDGWKAFTKLIAEGRTKGGDEEVAITKQTYLVEQQGILNTLAARYEKAKADGQDIKQLKQMVDNQAQLVDSAKKAADEAQENADEWNKVSDSISDSVKGLSKYTGYMDELTSSTKELMEAFASEETGETFGAIADGLGNTLAGLSKVATGVVGIVTGTDIVGGTISLIAGLASVIASVAKSIQKVKGIDIESSLKKQNKIIDQLARAYKNLGDAIEDAFGAEYIAIYRQRQQLLEAEIEATKKNIETLDKAARDAKTDKEEDKYTEQLDAERDKLHDLEEDLKSLDKEFQSFFTGSDITSAAKDFASAWLDAYKSFGSTTNAMKEKFREMIDEMVTSSLAAEVMKGILKDVYAEIDAATEDNKLDEEEIARIAELTKEATANTEVGMRGLMDSLAQYGISMRGTATGLTGIAKDFSGMTEEAALGVAAGINTQNYYMSYVPTISQNVALIAELLGTEGVASQPGVKLTPASEFGDEVFRGHMNSIDDNIAILVDLVRSVRSVKSSSTNTHVLAVTNK